MTHMHNCKPSRIQILKNFKIAWLNSISVITIGGNAVYFWHNLYELDNFSWHHVMTYRNIFIHKSKAKYKSIPEIDTDEVATVWIYM